jgi:hypothetical protein
MADDEIWTLDDLESGGQGSGDGNGPPLPDPKVTPLWTVVACIRFGGCCGRYDACVVRSVTKLSRAAGRQRCAMTCWIQFLSAIFMPLTLCGFLWGLCGACSPCTKKALVATHLLDDAPVASQVDVNPPDVVTIPADPR